MSVPMKKRHTKNTFMVTCEGTSDFICLEEGSRLYIIPRHALEKFAVDSDDDSIPAEEIFRELYEKESKNGVLLQGLRDREELTQEKFSKKIGVSQSNLSKMEHGKRPVGKKIALRIEKAFGVNHKIFLED